MTLHLIVILFFVAILLGLVALSLGYEAVRTSPSFELKKRLKNMAVNSDERIPFDLRVEIMQGTSPFDKLLYRFGAVKRLDRMIDNAGVKMDVKVFILILIASALAGMALGIVLGIQSILSAALVAMGVINGFLRQVVLSLVLGLLGIIVPFIFLKFRSDRRVLTFTEQFPNALDMIARSLKAGHALSAAIQMIGKETSNPTAGLFKTAYDEQSLGLTMKDALEHMLQRMKSSDLQLFVAAVNIHKDIGGNLSETLEKLGETIRERLKVRRQVRVFSAQSRLSAIILVLLPPLMTVFFYYRVPGYMDELLTNDIGKMGIAYAIVSQIVGIIIIKKIIDIRI
ncbi:MAG: type II secretion system F family protein [Nitrospirae bacterium]|nr:type II secretion system F family protein [Nitrospirota bacterium]